jgi:lysophospholipase L1-like esterase
MADAGRILPVYQGDWVHRAYEILDQVTHAGSTYTAKNNIADSTITPDLDTTNWFCSSKGFVGSSLSDITATDTSGLLGAVGAEVGGQELTDEIANRVATELLPYSHIINDQTKEDEGYAADARQLNPNIENSLAYKVNQASNKLVCDLVKRLQSGQVEKIKLIGDSITEGYGATNHVNIFPNVDNGNPVIFNNTSDTIYYESLYTDANWANKFRKYINNIFPTVQFVNAGIGGKDTTWALANKQYWVENEEDVMFVMLGANDRWNITPEQYKTNLVNFLAYIKAHCNQIIVMSTPMSKDDTTITFTTNLIDRIVTEVCIENRYPHISLYRELKKMGDVYGIDPEQFLHDTTHTNNLGHSAIWMILQDKLGIADNTLSLNDILKNQFGKNRQFIIDGNFQVAQANPIVGSEIINPTAYSYPVFDMWKVGYYLNSGSFPTIKHSQRRITDSGAQYGSVQFSKYCYRINVNGSGTISDGIYDIINYVENGVSNYCISNEEIIVTFFARSSISGKKIRVGLELDYGTGGNPSASSWLYNPSDIDLTNNWKKHTAVFKCPDFSTKTFGTNNNDKLALHFSLAGTFQNFVGSGDIEITQVCAGSQFTKFKYKTFNEELTDCQRYYEKSYKYTNSIGSSNSWDDADFVVNTGGAYHLMSMFIKYKVPKYAIPTMKIISFDGTGNTIKDLDTSTNLNTSSVEIVARSSGFEIVSPTNTFVNGHVYGFQWVADCRL